METLDKTDGTAGEVRMVSLRTVSVSGEGNDDLTTLPALPRGTIDDGQIENEKKEDILVTPGSMISIEAAATDADDEDNEDIEVIYETGAVTTKGDDNDSEDNLYLKGNATTMDNENDEAP